MTLSTLIVPLLLAFTACFAMSRRVDVYSALVDEKGMLDKQYTNDGLHLMGEGYLAWKTVIEKFVR